MSHELDKVGVLQINGGDDESADITLEYNTKRINISIFATKPPTNSGDASLVEAAIENQIIRLLNKAIVADDSDYDALIDEALDHILHVCQSTFSHAAQPIWQKHRTIQDRSGRTRCAKRSKIYMNLILFGENGKPSNVVVDQSGDAWLIDFAGGWSRGWVDKQLAGTVKGDDQAVERIVHFLGL